MNANTNIQTQQIEYTILLEIEFYLRFIKNLNIKLMERFYLSNDKIIKYINNAA